MSRAIGWGGLFVGQDFYFWRAVLKRRFEDLNLLQIDPFWFLELQGPFLPLRQAGQIQKYIKMAKWKPFCQFSKPEWPQTPVK